MKTGNVQAVDVKLGDTIYYVWKNSGVIDEEIVNTVDLQLNRVNLGGCEFTFWDFKSAAEYSMDMFSKTMISWIDRGAVGSSDWAIKGCYIAYQQWTKANEKP